MSIETYKMTTEQLGQFAQCHINWIKQCFADGIVASWAPSLAVLIQAEGRQLIEIYSFSGTDFNDTRSKHQTLRWVGAQCCQNRRIALGVVFSAESWLSRNPVPGVQPKDDPAREEEILVIGLSCSREACMTSAPIVRQDGRILTPEFGPMRTEELSFPLLDQFYAGYLEEFQRRQRMPEFSAN